MKRYLLRVFLILSAGAALWGQPKIYPNRWIYLTTRLADDAELDRFRQIARTASEHGFTGLVIPRMDAMDLKTPDYFARLKQARETCARYGIEIIPHIFNTGYGGPLLAHDQNLAEGLEVRGALFVARNGEARFSPDSPPGFKNGGFEEYEGHRLKDYSIQDEPGKVTFVDTEVVHSGKASVRFEGRGARLAQDLQLKPYRSYRFQCWIKAEGARSQGPLRVRAMTADNRDLAFFQPGLRDGGNWRQLTGAFNSWYADKISFQISASGKVWIDDLTIEEVGLTNVLRRPGTPVRVRNEKTGTVYAEGRDFAPIADPRLSSSFDHDGPPITLLPKSRIKEGDRLRVDFYHGARILQSQTVPCVSEPKTHEIWAQQIPLLEEHVAPKRYFLGMDELRILGRCQACRSRGMTMAQIVGDTVTRQYKMIRKVNPKAEIYVWSDMFDPNHNARDKYYLVDGDITGSWKYIPRDIGIVCWNFGKRRASLDFFSELGFKTVAGAYYDADDLENPKGWLDALDSTRGAVGIMYTTWRNKFDLLAPFGDLVSKR